MAKANRNHKDSVFSFYFSDSRRIVDAYNAIEGRSYPEDADVEFNTLEDVLFKDRINDISFLLDGKLIVLIEYQSDLNQNMPLRMLLYIGRLYEKIIENRNIYKNKLVKIPKPDFIVLYNGEKEYEDRGVLKLSDAFREADLPVLLELTVNVCNINNGRNAEILKKSRALGDYAAFTAKVREFRAKSAKDENALAEAVKYCIKNGIMEEFLLAHGSEVVNMLLTEFNMDDAKMVWQEEAKEDGIEEVAVNLIRKGMLPYDAIAEATGLSPEKIAKLAQH